jgi:SAM-dependent methyltransferase
MTEHAQVRYLEAKRSVDEESRSRRVADRFVAALPATPRVLEAGAGTGSLVPWLVERGVTAGSYRGVEASAAVVAHARHARPAELRYRGREVTTQQAGSRVADLGFCFEVGDALAKLPDDEADAVVAQQFMDLVSIPEAVEAFTDALAPGGVAYFPLTFDGLSVFEPGHEADGAVERAYHEAIDQTAGRTSHAGRRLATHLQRAPGELVAMDAADGIVRPRRGGYRADERYFLECILGFVESSVGPESAPAIDDWLQTRRQQLARGTLLYVGHRYDLLYRTPADGA